MRQPLHYVLGTNGCARFGARGGEHGKARCTRRGRGCGNRGHGRCPSEKILLREARRDQTRGLEANLLDEGVADSLGCESQKDRPTQVETDTIVLLSCLHARDAIEGPLHAAAPRVSWALAPVRQRTDDRTHSSLVDAVSEEVKNWLRLMVPISHAQRSWLVRDGRVISASTSFSKSCSPWSTANWPRSSTGAADES